MVDVEVGDAVAVGGALLVGVSSELVVLVDVGLVLARVGAGVLAGGVEEDVEKDDEDVEVEEGSSSSAVLLVGCSV
jgi:hypothetical protein